MTNKRVDEYNGNTMEGDFMHIDKLKYYIDLYECKNFTETAKKNFISQAALSQFISSLEKQFGLSLFDRSQTPIKPTAAGTSLYEESKILYKQYEYMLERMDRIKTESMPALRIAYSSPVDIQALLPIVSRFKESYPDAELKLNRITLKEADEYISKELCDLVVSFSTEFIENKHTKFKVLKEGRYMAVVGKGHDLFDKNVITTEELYKYPLIMLSKEVIGNLYDKMLERVKEDGFKPIIEKTVDDIESEMFSIITDGFIGFAPESQSLSDFGDSIKMIPIEGSSHKYCIAACYLKENKNQTLKAFLELI